MIGLIEDASRVLKKARLKPLLMTEDGCFIQTNRGFFIGYNPQTFAGKLWGVEHDGHWEEEAVAECISRLRGLKGVFIDVGANAGYYSIAVAREVPEIGVHAFEPVPENFEMLRRNIQANGMNERIWPNRVALGQVTQNSTMTAQGQLSRIAANGGGGNHAGIEVHMTTIDDYCLAHGVHSVRLIKCDVEGYELSVLKGAVRVVQENKPLILLEVAPALMRTFGYTQVDIVRFLRDLDYRPSLSWTLDGLVRTENTDWEADSGLFLFESDTRPS